MNAVWCDFRLKPLDVIFMKSLHHKVNIIPVIAKADMLTPIELKKLKKKVNILLILKVESGDSRSIVIVAVNLLTANRVVIIVLTELMLNVPLNAVHIGDSDHCVMY